MTPINHILLIDDDSMTNFIHKTIISKSGICENVKPVLTGKEGLDYLKECHATNHALPEMIFLDINMPEMSGWDFLEEFALLDSQIRDNISIYMLSSSQNHHDLTRASDNPFVSGFFNKPLGFQLLRDTFLK